MSGTQQERAALLETGAKLLAAGHGAAALTPGVIMRLAGTGPDSFKQCFPDVKEFKAELLRRLLNEILSEAAIASEEMLPGIPRMCRATEVYLDATLRRPAVRELMFTLHGHPAANEVNKQRINGFVMIFRAEFDAVGAERAEPAARIATALVVETAMAEFEARRALPEFREALYAYFRRYEK
ncbi:MAG: hypothetical protein E6R07_09665 [Nevskiaceae bacterium]|nr:MAG: hypothetical protein E6R07_09665 [Nevskiaceae bacterium]